MQTDFEPVRRLKLTKPIHYAGEDITEIGFREPTCKTMEVIEVTQANPKNGQSIPLLAHFTGISVMALERMKLSDAVKAVEIVGELLVESGIVGGDTTDEETDSGKP